MQEKEFVEDEGISLFELWGIIRRGWYWLVSGIGLGAIIAVLAVVFLPLRYEAVALLQVGQIGQVGQLGLVAQAMGVPLESPAQAIERMRTGGFQSEAAKFSGYQPWIESVVNSAKTGEEYFSLQPLKNTQLIEIRGKAETREDAAKITNAIVDVLAKRHAELAAPAIDRLEQDLLLAQDKLEKDEKGISALRSWAPSANIKDERFSPIALAASMSQIQQSELISLRQNISALKMALSAPATQPTRAVEATYMGEKPVSPKKGLIVVVGVLLGFLVGLLGLFVANAWKAGKAKAL